MLSKFSVKKTLYNCRCSNCCIDFRGYILYEFGYGFTSQYRFALYSYNDHISWGGKSRRSRDDSNKTYRAGCCYSQQYKKNISSISRENTSAVILEFNNDTNMDSATIEINSMLDLVKPAWDDYNIGSPMLMRLNPDMLPVMISAVDVKDLDIVEISQLVNEEIIPELESINGVASVTGIGLLEEKK